MKKIGLLFYVLFFTILSYAQTASNDLEFIEEIPWISISKDSVAPNTWLAFKKSIHINDVQDNLNCFIAADTKYWLWINEKLIIREGGLKWGPSPTGYYVDQFNAQNYLRKGKNEIKILVWYMGKDGFSHKNSHIAGLKFALPALGLQSDESWQVAKHNSFKNTSTKPLPNYRLPESNIHFDAADLPKNCKIDQPLFGFAGPWKKAMLRSNLPAYQAVPRPIPFWKDYGLKAYDNNLKFPFVSKGDTLEMKLPYNAQITPYFEIKAKPNLEVDVRTDNYFGGGPPNLRLNYSTNSGRQVFESPAWINGHTVRYYFPKGIKIYDLKFRESGFDTNFTGSFECDDAFYNALWEKSLRTLYITMRDNYMDCPDRERALWWGDAVLEIEEAFFALDRKSDLLAAKSIAELLAWQKEDATLFSPIPAGNWNKELPTQMLASIGLYGIWNYYLNSGDKQTLKQSYPAIQKYLKVWKLNEEGLVKEREGGWLWLDWGKNQDRSVIMNAWYYLALKGYAKMSNELNVTEEFKWAEEQMRKIENVFNKKFWKGDHYKSNAHQGLIDDRANALAVLCGFTPKENYPFIKKVLMEQKHASPYFEKYVLEALFSMNYPNAALTRMRSRFQKMVDSPLSTLWEGWDIGSAEWGGGTYNHAWSGGGLTLLSKYVAGIQVLDPGYTKVLIKPRLGNLRWVKATVDTPLGLLKVDIKNNNGALDIDISKPEAMQIEIVK